MQSDAKDRRKRLGDVRAVDDAWREAELLNETPIPWDDVKRDLGLL